MIQRGRDIARNEVILMWGRRELKADSNREISREQEIYSPIQGNFSPLRLGGIRNKPRDAKCGGTTTPELWSFVLISDHTEIYSETGGCNLVWVVWSLGKLQM